MTALSHYAFGQEFAFAELKNNDCGVEVCQFTLRNSCNEYQLLNLLGEIEQSFLSRQSGFQQHQLFKLNNRDYIDISISENYQQATQTSAKRLDSPLTLSLMDMMEPNSIKLRLAKNFNPSLLRKF